jgi:DNA-binding MarR family transcriptional regulator
LFLNDEGECRPTRTGSRLGNLARQLHRERRLRDDILSEGLFGEPAWDILLDLFACEAEGRTVRVNSACIGAAVPASTALRYLAELERRGLIERSRDEIDRRGQYVRLTPEAREHMVRLLERMLAMREGAAGG